MVQRQVLTKKIFLKRLNENGKDLIGEWLDSKHQVLIKCLNCENIHKYYNSISALQSKKCRKCSGRKITKEKYSQDIDLYGYSLTTTSNFISTNKPVELICNKCGHIRKLKRAKWIYINPNRACCNNLFLIYSEKDIIEILSKNNFTLISQFFSLSKPLKIQCNNCSTTYAVKQAFNAIRRKHCDFCQKHPNVKYTITDIKNICYTYKISILDSEFTTVTQKYNFICANNHKFNKQFSEMQKCFNHGNNGCPFCNSGKNEKLLGEYLNELFTDCEVIHNFTIKANIKNNNINIRKLIRVDYVINKYKLYIEYNGPQHYDPVRFGSMDALKAKSIFDNQIIRDNWLRNYCVKNNLTLLEIDGRKYKGESIMNFLKCNLQDLIKLNE